MKVGQGGPSTISPVGGGPAKRGAAERFRGLLESIPIVVYEAEPQADGAWHYVSDYVETLLGYRPEEFLSDPLLWLSLIHPDERDAVVQIEDEELEAARGHDVVLVSEYRLLHRDGHTVWVRDASRLVGPPDEPMWQGVWIDVTTERALLETYDRYRGLIEALSTEEVTPARSQAVTARTPTSGSPGTPDVYRLTCRRCGTVWGAERVEACPRCGSREVEQISLDATLRELDRVSAQVSELHEAVKGHLDALTSSLRARAAAAPEPTREHTFRVITRDPD